MSKQFKYSCYKATFRTIPEVMDHMMELNHELRRTDLSNLQFFNITYFIITKNVYAKIGKEYFSEEILVQKLDSNFASYYFDALRKYVDGQITTPAWKITFDFCKEDQSMPLIYLALGVNAHVNNDLGLSLFDVVKETDFKKDFDKVNPVIFASLDEVINEANLNKFYKSFMRLLIWHWRYKAWNNFSGLKEKTLTKGAIETNAQDIAVSLARIYSVKDFYHFYKVI